MDDDPYAAPEARLEDPVEPAEEVRRAHIRREVSLRSVGLLYWLGALGFAGLTVTALVGGTTSGVAVPAFFAVLFAVTGYGFRSLSGWVRVFGGLVSVFGLLLFPLGTLLNGYFLFLMFSPKGTRVFARDYADIRAATPHVRFERGLTERVVLGGILALLVAAFAWIVWGMYW